jgi:hypothetical protein
MKSNILRETLSQELIHFESEGLNYFHNPFSSDLKSIDCNNDKTCWVSLDPSESEKPLTIVVDLEATAPGIYTGRVKGFYLLRESISQLKTYEGDHDLQEKLEYFTFTTPSNEIIEEVDSPIDEKSYGFAEGFKEKLLALLC